MATVASASVAPASGTLPTPLCGDAATVAMPIATAAPRRPELPPLSLLRRDVNDDTVPPALVIEGESGGSSPASATSSPGTVPFTLQPRCLAGAPSPGGSAIASPTVLPDPAASFSAAGAAAFGFSSSELLHLAGVSGRSAAPGTATPLSRSGRGSATPKRVHFGSTRTVAIPARSSSTSPTTAAPPTTPTTSASRASSTRPRRSLVTPDRAET